MSQQKVDRYKEYKKNRKENIEKEKRQQKRTSMLWRIGCCVLALAIVVALGITVYNAISRASKAAPQYDREQLVVQDVAGIYETTTAEPETTTAEPETTEAESSTEPASEAETTAVAP